MSFDVTTLALAKSYADQHSGGGGASTANKVNYTNAALPNISTVSGALDELVPKSHTHSNKDTLDKLSDSNGNLTYNGEPIGGENTIYIPAKLIQSAEDMPTIKTSATFEQIEAAYNLGREQILKLVAEGSVDFIYMLPLVFAGQGEAFYFETIIGNQSVFVSVTPTNEWGLEFYDITPTPKEEIVNDVLAALPTWTGGSY